MPRQMIDAMLDVMRDYPIARQTPRHAGHGVHAMLGEVREGAEKWLAHTCDEHADLARWRTRASTGRGKAWANVCWVSIMMTQETTTAQDGRYLAWLFDAQGRHVVCALVWGTAKYRRAMKGGDIAGGLRRRRASCAGWLEARLDPEVFSINEDVDLGAGTPLARDYERSCLAWRRYETAEELAQMRADFETLLGVYVEVTESASMTDR